MNLPNLLPRLHTRLDDFGLRSKPGCAPNGEMLSYPHAEGTGNALHDGQPHDGLYRPAVTDVSALSDNVLLDDDGQLRFIDPLIRLKKPTVEVVSTLISSTVS